ncbi:galactokinase [Kocuria rhizophila]|uniref:galactokinase n=1 Tax=Kocuria rhizophila TaxID=72000 RepID=UPI00174CC845|nr:galactokinase family protein [Kocuria rhizophila]
MSCEPAVVAPPEEAGCPQWVPQPDVLARAELLSERFERAYGRAPVGVWAAPGRANLMGEYIDYSGGMCLPFAHQYVTLTAAAPRTDGVLRALSLQDADESVADHRLRTTSVADIAPGAIGGWFGYAAGVAWGMQRVASGHSDHPVAVPELALAPDFGADLMVDSTVPIGAGLASSAALECSVALALFSLSTGDDAPDDRLRRALARACMDAENHIVGANTGGLDQTASLRSHAGETLALDCRDFDAAAVLERFDALLRAGATTGADPEGMRLRLRHSLTEMVRSVRIADQLATAAPDWALVGRLLVAGHESMRLDCQVTVPELDAAVSACLDAGALGAKVVGGGFGGSVIALAREDELDELAASVCSAFSDHGFRDPLFLTLNPSPAGQRVR